MTDRISWWLGRLFDRRPARTYALVVTFADDHQETLDVQAQRQTDGTRTLMGTLTRPVGPKQMRASTVLGHTGCAPLSTTWSSAATNRHPDAQAAVFEEFDISDQRGALVQGTNILAIQGLNCSSSNSSPINDIYGRLRNSLMPTYSDLCGILFSFSIIHTHHFFTQQRRKPADSV